MKFTDEQIHEMAERNRRGSSDRFSEGYGSNLIPSSDRKAKGGGADSARQRMLDQMRTNPDRHSAEAKEERKQREAEKTQKEAFRKLSREEQWEEKRKQEEAERLDRWAELQGYHGGYEEYEAENGSKHERTSYFDRMQRQKNQR